MTTVYVPRDAVARALGSDDIAARILAAAPPPDGIVRVVRNGSWGMHWLEPLVEVDHDGVRHAFGPVTAADIDGLLAAGLLEGGASGHPLALGPTEDLAWLKDQQRLTFARVGRTDPLSADDFLAHGGTVGLARALDVGPQDVVDLVTASGLRGRGAQGSRPA